MKSAMPASAEKKSTSGWNTAPARERKAAPLIGLRGKTFAEGEAALKPPATWAPAAPTRVRGERLVGGHRPAPAVPDRALAPTASVDETTTAYEPTLRGPDAYAPPAGAYGGGAQAYAPDESETEATPETTERETPGTSYLPTLDQAPKPQAQDPQPAQAQVETNYLAGLDQAPQVKTPPVTEPTPTTQAPDSTYVASIDQLPVAPAQSPAQAPAQVQAPAEAVAAQVKTPAEAQVQVPAQAQVPDHYADPAAAQAARAAKVARPRLKRPSKRVRFPKPTEEAQAQAQGVLVVDIMYPHGRPDSAKIKEKLVELIKDHKADSAPRLVFALMEDNLAGGAKLLEEALREVGPSIKSHCAVREMLANVYRHIGDEASARVHSDFVAKYSSERDQRQRATDKLKQQAGPGKSTFPEQGEGNVAKSPSLDAQQTAIRQAAAQSKDPKRLDATNQQEGTGWALVGLEAHGYDMDTSASGKDIAYHGETERKGALLKLVGGRFVHAEDDSEVKSTLDEDNVAKRMPRAVNEKVKQMFMAKLQKRGMVAEAEQMKGMDCMGDLRQLVPLYRQVAPQPADFAKVKSKARVKAAAEGRMIYVMNRSGEFFAGDAELFKTHHSTFLAGGAVACAGDIELSGGRVVSISNNSGHYMPGPASLWQAVRQLQLEGVDIAAIQVEVMGAGKLDGQTFVTKLDPSAPGTSTFLPFSAADGVKKVRALLAGGAA